MRKTTRLRRAIRRLLPREVTRRIYRWQANQYVKNLKVDIDPHRKTILALNHFYDQDLRALANANGDYNFVKIDAPTLFKGAKIFFRPDVQGMHAPYESEAERNRLQWREECHRLFDLLDKMFGISLILSPSDEFYWIREFIHVAREHGVRTVIVDKEGTKSPQYFEAESARIRRNAPFISDHVYVWSERQRQFWNKIGVADDNISVIGQPRADLLYIERRQEVDRFFSSVRPLVTFFSYEDDAYIPVEIALRERVTWRSMKRETHEEVHRLAQRFTNYNFVVKTHPQQLDLAELQSRYHLDNLRVIGGASVANELIQRSELIIAFQTTAVIEAMFLNKPVLYTYWDPLLARFENDLLPFHKAPGIVVARSLKAFRQSCERFLNGDRSEFEFSVEQLRRREQFVNEYLYQPDGRVCERFYDSVKQFVK